MTTTTDHTRARVEGGHSHGPHAAYSGESRGASRADRLTSFHLDDFPLPTGREEEWRFTPVARLEPLFASSLSDDAVRVSVSAPAGVRHEQVGRDDSRLGLTPPPGDRAAAAAWQSFRTAHVITVTESAEPGVAHVTIEGVEAAPSAGHIVVITEPNATGTVVLDHRGSAVHTQNVEMIVGEGSRLTVLSIQDWDLDAVHASAHGARVGKDAYLKHVVVTLGGALVRMTPEATFSGTGGEVEALGIYLTDSGQHHEHRLYVDHDLPDCRSRVTYKGALQGAGAHSVWVGDVLIRVAAEGTDTYELNRNLVLTDGARADSVPNLEIETGEIAGAGHASATGRFDDEQLFYLMARGIPEQTARRLVVHGFFAELVSQIGIPDIETRLIDAIDEELAKSESADGTGQPAASDARGA